MRGVELVATMSGAAFALSVSVAVLTCSHRRGRVLVVARPLLAAVAFGVLASSFAVNSAPPVAALAAVALGVALFSVGVHLSALVASPLDGGSWKEPTWWPSFEEAFWRHVG